MAACSRSTSSARCACTPSRPACFDQATRDDPRVTRVGAFLRRTSLDELPQFFNVLRGDMSVVGPRPHALEHDDLYQKFVSGYIHRYRIKPGITGWAQVNGFRGETDRIEKMEGRVAHDLYYLGNWSFGLDMRIIAATIIKRLTPHQRLLTQGTTNMLIQKQTSTTSLATNRGVPAFRLGALAAAATLCTLFAGCGLAPGMRMQTPATLVETSNDAGDPATEVNIPITPIDLSLVRKMRAQQPADGPDPLASLFGTPAAYKLGVGDVLQITVWDHPELAAAFGQPNPNTRTSDAAPGFIVDADGNLRSRMWTIRSMQRARPPKKCSVSFTRELSKVFVKPQLTVRVASFRATQVYIDGEVRAPGSQTINDIPMTLTEAISRAGGFATDGGPEPRYADSRWHDVSHQHRQMRRRGTSPSNIMLQPGDLLRVDARDENGIYVMGEVNKPAL